MSLHVEISRVKGGAFGDAIYPLEVAGGLVSSETLATAGVQSAAVPSGGDCVMTLTPEIDMWIAMGTNPVATTNPRRRLKAGVTRAFAAAPGIKVVWSAS